MLMAPGIERRFLGCPVHKLVPLVTAQSRLVPMCMFTYGYVASSPSSFRACLVFRLSGGFPGRCFVALYRLPKLG
jgi:hypothetical protein